MNQPTNRPTVHANRPPPPAAKPLSVFAKAREKAQAAAQEGQFYSSEAKQDLFDNLTPLWLHGAHLRTTGKFGEQWHLRVSENDPDTEPGVLTFAKNGYRDSLFGDLADTLGFDSTPIGPLLLSKMITRSGQESWDLIEWTQGDLES